MSSVRRIGRRVAIVGAGITGLAAAHRMATRFDDVFVDVLESSDRVGGIIRTEHRDGFLIEHGPDAFITNKPGAVELCDELGFSGELIGTNNLYRRSLVVRNGRPLRIPEGFMLMAPSQPTAILTTPILSIPGRLRLLAEAVMPRRRENGDESLASFVRRRFGRETLDRLVQPLIGGIYTSDPEKLSLLATLPRFIDMERDYGSVIRGTLAQRESDVSVGSGARYGLFATPTGGLERLIDKLTAVLEQSGRVNLQTDVVAMRVEPNVPHDGWMLSLKSRAKGASAHVEYDAVILTTPAYVSSKLLDTVGSGHLAAELKTIDYASTVIVTTAHRLTDFSHPLDAFGMVVPAKENRRVLAVSFASRKFADRAPADHVLLRSFIGGALQPDLFDRSDDQLRQIVSSELQDLLGMKRQPQFSVVARHHNAMPQYHVGHLDRVAEIDRVTSDLPYLELAGSAFRGVGIPDCISSGRDAADRLAGSAGW